MRLTHKVVEWGVRSLLLVVVLVVGLVLGCLGYGIVIVLALPATLIWNYIVSPGLGLRSLSPMDIIIVTSLLALPWTLVGLVAHVMYYWALKRWAAR